MDEAMTDIRRAIIDEELRNDTIHRATNLRRELGDETSQRQKCGDGIRRGPEAGLLSREATASVDTAFNTLAQTVKKHEPTLEDAVRETLAPC